MSLNSVQLSGRLVADPDVRTAASNSVPIVNFRVAVDRNMSKEARERAQQTNAPTADFITVVAFRQTAELVSKFFKKGAFIIVEGRLQSRSYTAQDGSRRYVTEVVANRVHFGPKSNGAAADASLPEEPMPSFEDSADDVPLPDDLPF